MHYVDGLKYRLLSVLQIYNKGHKVNIMSDKYTVTSLKDGKYYGHIIEEQEHVCC